MPVLSAQVLLRTPARQALVTEIRRLVRLSPAHYAALYQPVLEAFARYVQELPASEAHHHAGPGGLLDHGLEVAVAALKLRRGHILPSDAPTETVKEQAELWSYAVLTAALLHDAAKPAADQEVALFDINGRALGVWNAWAGPMPREARWYRMRFRRGRTYSLHRRAALLQARLLVPDAGLRWLTGEPDVLAEWIAAVSGEQAEAGVLGNFITHADALSTAADLTGGVAAHMPGARAIPLHERLVTGLRHLLDQGTMPLNRPGAAGWLIKDELWLVVKTTLDRVREHLEQEGQTGIPADNRRLMDELQQRGVLIPCGDRAVWRAAIQLGDWKQTFTMLRIPATRLWADREARPASCEASVVASMVEGERHQATDVAGACMAQAPSVQINEPEQPSGDEQNVAPLSNHKHDAAMAPAVTDEAPNSPYNLSESDSTESETERNTEATDQNLGQQFLRWIIDGLQTRRLPINAVDARVHRVQEGLLLVSPALFKDFASAHGVPWAATQKRFQKLKLHRKTADGFNIWTYAVIGDRRKKKRLKGLVIVEPEQVLNIGLPSPNPHLSLLLEAQGAGGEKVV